MNDKERLEELAYNVGVSLDGEKALMSSDDYDFLYNYALQQAERVNELETTVDFYQSALRDADRRVQELEKQNKRYQKALENIVNCDGWLLEPNPFRTIEEAYERYVDETQKALEGEE